MGQDFWVYVFAESISKLQRLQLNLSAEGVNTYVVSGGELDGNLSVGLYSKAANAEQAAAPLRAKGYPVKILRRDKTESAKWLLLSSEQLEAAGWGLPPLALPVMPAPPAEAVSCE